MPLYLFLYLPFFHIFMPFHFVLYLPFFARFFHNFYSFSLFCLNDISKLTFEVYNAFQNFQISFLAAFLNSKVLIFLYYWHILSFRAKVSSRNLSLLLILYFCALFHSFNFWHSFSFFLTGIFFCLEQK